MKRIGLALGGGGARGLAHIPMLQVFDDLGLRPHRISGTSIGAVIGALYAAGMTARQIHAAVDAMLITRGESLQSALRKRDALRWLSFLDLEFSQRAIFKGDKFIDFLYEAMGADTFEELQIPLRVVTTDFWKSEQVVLESGPLLPAVKASMGLPGVFTPVVLNGRTLIDGGGVNPLPHDLLTECDYIVAVDVMGALDSRGPASPNLVRAVLGTFDIMQHTIIEQRRLRHPPDLYIRPDIIGIDLLEFYKAPDIYSQAAPAAGQLRKVLERLGP